MAITARAAIEAAAKSFHEYFPSAIGMRLEEVRKSEDERHWLVTLSYLARVPNEVAANSQNLIRAFQHLAEKEYERLYKQFEVDVDTGEALGMTIRKI